MAQAARSPALPRVFEQAEVPHPGGLGGRFARVVGEFWTARQKQMNPLHYVISYRASFKPELPAYFIERLCPPGGVVYDPFSGRGTTALQANMMNRPAVASDVNPLAIRMTRAKCRPVPHAAIANRLAEVDWDAEPDMSGQPIDDLLAFYHPDTLRQLLNLRSFLFSRRAAGPRVAALPKVPGASEMGLFDSAQEYPACQIDDFIELVAMSRLHGHSDGFFSVYSFPQISVPAKGQRRINQQRNQQPQFRPVAERIIRKARLALRQTDVPALNAVSQANRCFVASADAVPADELADNSVDLIVTSPPFLAKANYLLDNWLEFWFAGIDPTPLEATLVQTPSLKVWRRFMGAVIGQMARVLRPGGHAVIEVGEVMHDGKLLHLDEVIIEEASGIRHQASEPTSPARRSTRKHCLAATRSPDEVGTQGSASHRLSVVEVLIHSQKFTKLANCFSVSNNAKGTNTNRLVVLRKT